jgi:hypothetical protein
MNFVPATFSKSVFTTLEYEESRKSATGNIAGSFNISPVKIQAAKASLKNGNTKEVELVE